VEEKIGRMEFGNLMTSEFQIKIFSTPFGIPSSSATHSNCDIRGKLFLLKQVNYSTTTKYKENKV
jgi:hypothetical protein